MLASDMAPEGAGVRELFLAMWTRQVIGAYRCAGQNSRVSRVRMSFKFRR